MWNAFGSARPSTEQSVTEEEIESPVRCTSPELADEKESGVTLEYPTAQVAE
jgi:hypothetical protein